MSSANPRRRAPVTSPAGDSDSAPLFKPNMSLRKGATFHFPAFPTPQLSDNIFVRPQLPRSQSHLDDVVNANRRRVALTLSDIDEALAQTEKLSLSPKKTSKSLEDTGLPVPRGFLDLPTVDPAMAKSESGRPSLHSHFTRRPKPKDYDSGLGTSVASTNEKSAAADKSTKAQTLAPALTRSAASSTKQMLPALRPRTYSRIQEHIVRPLLDKAELRDFRPIVLDIPRRINNKDIICLRDLEKTLVFMAPKRAKTATLYIKFCLSSIQCIQATVEHLVDQERTRPGDRPYTNGYFLDLKEQIIQYGRQLHAARNNKGVHDDVDSHHTEEIKLHGGVAENGRPAELVRVTKDGTAISLATGEAVDMDEAPAKIKRSLSQQRDDEEEIVRSMARRKKNASPEELAPKRCREPGCHKEFKRPCDLTKHEKTHSRPWKCPMATCKYHEFGWPTEKEMDRHVNDKHSDAPAMYECIFKPCPYKSKRESNCKQHMEKAHGWHYKRTKNNGKKLSANGSSSIQQTPPLGNVSTPSTTPAYSIPTPPHQDCEAMASDFPLYPTDADWLATYGFRSDNLDATDLGLENPSPATSYEQYPPYQNGSTFILSDEDMYAAQVQLPAQPSSNVNALYNSNKMMAQQMPIYQAPAFPFPPALQPQLEPPPHFSPSGQENAMLYSPNSLREADEGFDETYGTKGAADFQLFPPNVGGGQKYQSLFSDAPSANLGFSQTSQPDMFQQIDWPTLDYSAY